MVRILIADDEVLLTIALRQQLELWGCEVVGTVANGQAAVDSCCAARPEVVFMDLRMPVMDGLTATRAIMGRCPTCVVMMTAYGAAETAARAEAEGVMGYLTKPVRVEQILASVSSARTRFAEFTSIREEAADLDEALRARPLVEAAKQALETRGEANGGGFRVLQERAGRDGCTLREAARRVLEQPGSPSA